MTGLRLVLDFANFNVRDPNTILTAGIFFGLAFLNHYVSVPTLDKVATYLKAGRRGMAVPPGTSTFHPTLVVFYPLMLGVWTYLVYLVAPRDFVSYIGDGLVLWPDYGRVAPWAINAIIALFAASGLGIIGSYIHFFGLRAGLITGSCATLLAASSFLGGVFAAPITIIYFLVTNRGMFIGYPFWAMKTLANRSLPNHEI